MELRNFRRWCHLYSAGRPSRWASAYILVVLNRWDVCDCSVFVMYLTILFMMLISWCSFSLPSSIQHLRNDDCPHDKCEDYQKFCVVFCMTVVHSDTHTREQFLKLTVGWGRCKCETWNNGKGNNGTKISQNAGGGETAGNGNCCTMLQRVENARHEYSGKA